jgi:O-antigen/teichoic acid export membrane protein
MKALITAIRRLWDSPTITTWLSFVTRGLGLLVLTPIILNRFSTAEINVWYLLLTLIGLQMLADFGFSPSFSRAIAYALGGVQRIEKIQALPTVSELGGEPNWPLLLRVLATMRGIYHWLSVGAVLLLGVGGTLALLKPISQLAAAGPAWGAWLAVLAATFVTFRGNFLVSYLQGINMIAILRRWEALWTAAGLITAAAVAWFGGGIFWVILANQSFSAFNVLWNLSVARKALGGKLKESDGVPFDREIFDSVWPAAWRSGLGVFMSNGVIQASSLVYAQIGAARTLASFLLAMRLMQTVVGFSQAPFYSKIPAMARSYAQGRRDDVLALARRGMQVSYAVFLAGIIGIGLFVPPLLVAIHSKALFVPRDLWTIMAIAFLIERIGAMNMQLYSLSNHIVWHIANGITGAVYIVLCFLSVPRIGIWGFPVSMAISYLLCYTTYGIHLAHKLFTLHAVRHELSTWALPSCAVLVGLLILSWRFSHAL